MKAKIKTYINGLALDTVNLNKNVYLRTTFVFAIFALLGGLILVGLTPSSAYALGDAVDAIGDWASGIWDWATGVANTVVDFFSDPVGAITETIGGWIKESIGVNYVVGEAFLEAIATGDVFTRPFELLLNANILDVLKNIWNSITVPIGDVMVLVFFVIGLCNVFKTVGQSDAGIDLWQILMCYLMLVVGILLINNSWDIMYLIYTVSLEFMGNLSDLITAENIPNSVWDIASDMDIGNIGQMMFYWLLSMCAMVIGVVIYALSYGLIAIRGIQIYLYTIFSPIPLAMVVSEGTRRDAGMFFKRYLAVILSGFLLVIIIVMLMLYLTQASDLNFEAGGPVVEILNFSGNYIVGFIMPVVFAWAMVKSGKWARDLLGIY